MNTDEITIILTRAQWEDVCNALGEALAYFNQQAAIFKGYKKETNYINDFNKTIAVREIIEMYLEE